METGFNLLLESTLNHQSYATFQWAALGGNEFPVTGSVQTKD